MPYQGKPPYNWKSLIKENPLYHKHVDLNVSRHRLKGTMQKFQNIKSHRENQRSQNNQRCQGKHYQHHRANQTTKQNTTFGPMPTLADIGLKVMFCCCSFGVLYGVDSCCLDLVGCFDFFGVPDSCWYFQMYTWFLEKARTWMRSFVE